MAGRIKQTGTEQKGKYRKMTDLDEYGMLEWCGMPCKGWGMFSNMRITQSSRSSEMFKLESNQSRRRSNEAETQHEVSQQKSKWRAAGGGGGGDGGVAGSVGETRTGGPRSQHAVVQLAGR